MLTNLEDAFRYLKMDMEPQIQFTLLDKKRERMLEETTCDGETSFQGLSPEIYSIRIAKQERFIGEIYLNIEKKD